MGYLKPIVPFPAPSLHLRSFAVSLFKSDTPTLSAIKGCKTRFLG